MRKALILTLLITALAMASAGPGFGVSKETIQMMQQLDTLQQQVQALQKTVDTQTAVLKLLVQQTNDNVSAMKVAVDNLKETSQQNLANSSARLDSMNNEVQALSASLDEAKARLDKLSGQLAQTQKYLETINTAQNSANANAPANGATDPNAQVPPAGAQPQPPPDPDTLYKSAYSDYSAGRYQLAIQGFQQYLQNYGDTDLASNAQFYIGDCLYLQKQYKQAIVEYDKCIQQYPEGNKVTAAQLKKAYALLALNQQTSGERELRSLIRRYPNSHEAALARQRLRHLQG